MNMSEDLFSIVKQVKDWENEIVRDLQSLVQIESVTYNESEAVRFLAAKMHDFDFDEVRVDAVGNVLGRIGSGKTVVLYDAHIDTVDLGNPEDWRFPPLSATVENQVLYGRGAVDDKSCLIGITYAGRVLKKLALDKDFTLWISGSISEEDVEGSCVSAMMKENPDIKPDYILVAEASNGRIMRGHKGRALIRITVPGKCAHASAAWRGDNALVKALPIIKRIDEYNEFVDDAFLGKGTIEVTNVECKAPSLNTIPGEAVITCDRRISCGETAQELIDEVSSLCAGIEGIKVEIDNEVVKTYTGYKIDCTDYFPSWVMEEDAPIVQAGVQTYRALFEKEPVVTKWDFCTNGTHLCGRMGIPAIGFGAGDEPLCHTIDDQIPLPELFKAIQFYSAFPLFLAAQCKQ